MKRKILIAFVLTSFNFVFAQNFNDALRLTEPGFSYNPRALGMGNAYIANSNDFGGSLFNPAGLGLVEESEFSASFNYNLFKNNATLFNNNTSFSNNKTDFNQIGVALPFPTYQGSFVVGFGYNQYKKFDQAIKFSGFNPFNSSLIHQFVYSDIMDDRDVAFDAGLSYPLYDDQGIYVKDTTLINGGLNQSGRTIQDGSLGSWTFSGALEFRKNIFIGVSFTRIDGDFRSDREYWEEDLRDNYPIGLLLDPADNYTADFQSFYFNDVIKWDVSAWDITMGLLAKLNDKTRFGIVLKLPRNFTIKETYYYDLYADFGTGKRYYMNEPFETEIKYEISTPLEFAAGGAYSLNDFTFSLDARLIDYTQMKFEKGLDDQTMTDNNTDIKNIFQSVVNLNAGAEYNVPSTGITVRGGFMYLPSPYIDDPSEFDKKIITMGLGIETGHGIYVDLAYAHGWWKNIGDNYSNNVSRTYQEITHGNFIMGMKYVF